MSVFNVREVETYLKLFIVCRRPVISRFLSFNSIITHRIRHDAIAYVPDYRRGNYDILVFLLNLFPFIFNASSILFDSSGGQKITIHKNIEL